MKTDEKAEGCGTQITLQNLAGLHLGKLGSASKTFEVLNIVKTILTALSFKDLAQGTQKITNEFLIITPKRNGKLSQ